MWNWLVSGLAAGRDAAALRRLAVHRPRAGAVGLRRRRADDALRHVGQVHRRAEEDRRSCRARTTSSRRCATMFSTGSPLAPESFDYVYQCVKDDLCLSSISGRHRHRLLLRAGRADAAGVARRAAVPRPRHGGRRVRRRRAGRCAATRASSSARAPFPSMPVGFWNDPGRREVPRRVLRALPRRLVPRRLRRAHRARRPRHLRPLRRDAQSRRRAHRHRRDLPPGRAAARGAWRASSSARTGRPARSATCASCCSSGCATGSRSTTALVERIRQHDPRQHDAAPRAGEGRAGHRHPAHQEQQDRRARGARRRARPRR